jgi:hypothetical protein
VGLNRDNGSAFAAHTFEAFCARVRAPAYLTTITLLVVPSVMLPLNLLLFADKAVPDIAVALLKNSLFDKRIVPPATLAPMLLLTNVLLTTFT